MASQHRRSVKNFLLDPNFQIKYALYFAASGMAFMGVLFTLFTHRINVTMEQMSHSDMNQATLESALSSVIYDVSLFCIVGFFLNILFSFGFAIYMTHRVAGAAFVIERYIGEIKTGKYDLDRTLRKSDDLQAVMAALRDLAAHLKSKPHS